jgi:hypothetical protein
VTKVAQGNGGSGDQGLLQEMVTWLLKEMVVAQ